MEIQPLDAGDYNDWFAAIEAAFGARPDAAERERDRELIEPRRALAAVAPDGARHRFIGTAAVIPLTMAVPGGTLPVAGVSAVSVSPAHRRQGVLSALMARQLADIHDAGETVAALFASEAVIYGRFGYGRAAWDVRVEAARGTRLAGRRPRRDLRLLEVGSGGGGGDVEALVKAYEQVWQERPGHFARDPRWWRSLLADDPQEQAWAPPVAAVTAGGYAVYQTKSQWGVGGVPDGEVRVRELVASDPEATVTLWTFLLGLDLMARVSGPRLALDDPLLTLAADPRRLQPRLADNLWVRLVDVPAALAARRYSAAVDAVVQVHDPLCPWNDGRFRLTADDRGADCHRVDAATAPDIALDVAELGAAYLGGTSLASQALAGRVTEHRHGAVAAVSAAFRGAREPLCPQLF
jgi:predicted acetyltransferase